MTLKKRDLENAGRIATGFCVPDADWQTNQQRFRLPRFASRGIELECRKEPQWLNCRMRLGESEEYTFRHPLPLPGLAGQPSPKFVVVIRWDESEVGCGVNGADMVTMPRDRRSGSISSSWIAGQPTNA